MSYRSDHTRSVLFADLNIEIPFAQSTIESFFTIMWSSSYARYNLKVVSVPPSDGRAANAILRVRVPQVCAQRGATPLIKPTREQSMTKGQYLQASLSSFRIICPCVSARPLTSSI